MSSLDFGSGRLHGLAYSHDTTVNLFLLKKQIDPAESLSAGHLIQELPVDPEFIPLMHFNSVFDPLCGDGLAGVLSPICGFHVFLLKLKLVRIHQIPLNLLNLMLSHSHVKQLIRVPHHTLAMGVTPCR